ncbi:MAG: hypothetical protein ACXVA9_07500 [Bdellovibrionales bacterium]
MLNKIIRSRRRLMAIAMVCASGVATTIVFQNCGKVGVSSKATNASESGGFGANGLPIIKVSDIPMQTANLGTKIVVPVNFTVPSSYSGTLKLEVLAPELKVLDPGAGIKFSFQPATLAITGGGQAAATLTIDVTTLAPSFDLSMFHVHASDMSNSAIVADASVPLSVKAIYEVQLFGRLNAASASPEKWSVAIGSVTSFISHPEGLSFKFVNMDKLSVHRVHSSGGPIAHEGNDMAASVDGTLPGGNYAIMIAPSATKGASAVYCHDHEGGGQIRTFQFNVPVVPVVTLPVASGNPNAKFAFINTNVIQSQCIACHSAAALQGGVNLSTYNNVLAFLTKGDSSISALYLAVAQPGGAMPLNGTPLSAALVKDISDWINDGAANN